MKIEQITIKGVLRLDTDSRMEGLVRVNTIIVSIEGTVLQHFPEARGVESARIYQCPQHCVVHIIQYQGPQHCLLYEVL